MRNPLTEKVLADLAVLCHPMSERMDDGVRMTLFVRAGEDALVVIGELERRLKRYEQWREIPEDGDPEFRRAFAGSQVWCFYGRDPEDDQGVWMGGTWERRPTWATHYCPIMNPEGPWINE